MKYSELERLLKKYGCWNTGEQSHGHPIWISPITGHAFQMSNHKSEEVAKGTLRKIITKAGI